MDLSGCEHRRRGFAHASLSDPCSPRFAERCRSEESVLVGVLRNRLCGCIGRLLCTRADSPCVVRSRRGSDCSSHLERRTVTDLAPHWAYRDRLEAIAVVADLPAGTHRTEFHADTASAMSLACFLGGYVAARIIGFPLTAPGSVSEENGAS